MIRDYWDEPVVAPDICGVFVGTRRWLPEHLKGKETVGRLVTEGLRTYILKPSGEKIEVVPGTLEPKP